MSRITPPLKKLSQYYQLGRFNDIAKLPGMHLIKQSSQCPQKKECFWYLKNQYGKEIYKNPHASFLPPIIDKHIRTNNPKEGDVVLYSYFTNGHACNHTGIIINSANLEVESKFGYGHVYRHPIDLIPNEFGPYYSLYTPAKSKHYSATIKNLEWWLKTYHSIASIKLSFNKNYYTESQTQAILKSLQATQCFLPTLKEYTGKHISRVCFFVENDYLNKKENRKALVDLLNKKRNTMPVFGA